MKSRNLLISVFLSIFLLFTVDGMPGGAFPAAGGQDEESRVKYWWQIAIDISAVGQYEYRSDTDTIKGNYSIEIIQAAAVERDNGDYLFYQGDYKPVRLSWKETVYNKNNVLLQEYDLANRVSPEIKMHYVMRRGKKIDFDLAISPLSLPVGGVKPVIKLILPASAENEYINPTAKYNRGIVKGSNRISTIEKGIYQKKEVIETFKWDWQRVKKSWPAISTSHSVEVKLKITRVDK